MTDHVLYAREGETINCPNGHDVATFAKDAYLNSPITASLFKAIGDTKCGHNDPLPIRCPQCGAAATRVSETGLRLVFHINGEWR